MQSKAATVDDYLAEQPPPVREQLSRLRALIVNAAGDVDEHMLHGMPSYLRQGEMLFAFAVQKQNLALYCCDTMTVSRFAARLKATSCGKSCIRFKSLAQLDLAAVESMLKTASKPC